MKGGRISKASGWFGTVLNICPLLNMDDQGRLIPRSKIRGKKAVIKEIVARMEQFADGGTNYNGKCYISNSACYEDARAVADLVEQKFPKLNGKVEINHVGTTIGSHTGPGTVALFFGAPSARNKTGRLPANRKRGPALRLFRGGRGLCFVIGRFGTAAETSCAK